MKTLKAAFIFVAPQADSKKQKAIISTPAVELHVAPGKLIEVSVSQYGKLYNGKPFVYHFKNGTIALDGEREIEIYREDDFLITLS